MKTIVAAVPVAAIIAIALANSSTVTTGSSPSPTVAAPLRASPTQRSETTVVLATAPVHRAVGRLVGELTIGTPDGPEQQRFSSISAVAVGANGSILIADSEVATVRQFDVNGNYTRTLGGTSDFQNPVALTTLSNGSTVVYSLLPRQLLFYDSDGRRTLVRPVSRPYTFNATLHVVRISRSQPCGSIRAIV